MYHKYKVIFGPIKNGRRSVELWREDQEEDGPTEWVMGWKDVLDLTFANGTLSVRWLTPSSTQAKLKLNGEDVINEYDIGIAPKIIGLRRFTPKWIEGKEGETIYAGFLPD